MAWITLATGVLFGFFPAIYVTGVDHAFAMRAGPDSPGGAVRQVCARLLPPLKLRCP